MTCCGGFVEGAAVSVPAVSSVCTPTAFVSEVAPSSLIAPPAASMVPSCECSTIPRYPAGVSQVSSESGKIVFNY